MATTTNNKQRVFNQLFTALGKGAKQNHEMRPVLDQFLYAICREGVTNAQADEAFRNLQERFFDWNEVRVSSTRELAEVMSFLPDSEQRAQRVVDFLQEVFETTFSFDMEWLHKKGMKQAAKQLSRYQGANDYVIASVTQNSLGGHAIPVDPPTLRTLRRLGIVEHDQEDGEALRASLEHQIPKARGAQFSEIISIVANEHCDEIEPNCPTCPMCKVCPTAQEAASAVPVSAGRSKTR